MNTLFLKFLLKLKKINYFSQKGQDKWIIEEVFNFKKNGYFLDLAASDGITDNNTYFLEKYLNWNGIAVEANQKSFEKLAISRKAICASECIDGKKRKVKFVNNSGMGGIVDKDTDNTPNLKKSKYYKLHKLSGRKISNEDLKKLRDAIEIKNTTTLEDLLDKYQAPKIIDFFSFDVEGAETRILKNFPFNKYIFNIIVIERPTPELNKILFKNGYIFLRKSDVLNNFDFYYVHKTFEKAHDIPKEEFTEVDPL